MTANDTVLQKLAEWQPVSGARQTLVIPDAGGGWTVTVTADRRDELGCLVWEILLKRAAAPTARGKTALGDWANGAAERVIGLLETLKVVEIDAERDEALLRSDEPAQRGEEVFYYEVLLSGVSQALVRRFHAFRNGQRQREQVAFALTHEALAKLVTDLTTE